MRTIYLRLIWIMLFGLFGLVTWRDKACYRKMMLRGCQVLTEGKITAPCPFQIDESFFDFVMGFSQSQHKPGFDRHTLLSRILEDSQRAAVVCLRPNHRVQAGDRLNIMIEHIRMGVTDFLQRADRASEIGDEHLDLGLVAPLADMINGSTELLCTAIVKIIAGNGSYDDVIQLQQFCRAGYSLRLPRVHFLRLATVDRAKTAVAGAAGAQNHEGRRAPVEAFP